MDAAAVRLWNHFLVRGVAVTCRSLTAHCEFVGTSCCFLRIPRSPYEASRANLRIDEYLYNFLSGSFWRMLVWHQFLLGSAR
jgi:hypothetical protein